MPFEAEDINDLIAGTLRRLGRGKWSQIAQPLQDYVIMRIWLARNRVRTFRGYGVQWTVMDRIQGGSGYTGLYKEVNADRGDHIRQANAPWRNITRSFAIDHREIEMNMGAEQIVDLVEIQRNAMMIDMAEDLELGGWQVPGASDKLLPYGIPYYVVWSSSAQDFTGQHPAGHSSVAGIDASNVTRWRNWSDTYAAVSDADLIFKMRLAFQRIRFRPPANVQGVDERYAIYCDGDTELDLNGVARDRNNQVGYDLAVGDGGMTVFHRIPLTYAPYLDSNAASGSQPIYMVNHGTFYIAVLANRYLRQTGPRILTNHNVSETFTDLSFQFVCENRRANAVLAKSAPFGES